MLAAFTPQKDARYRLTAVTGGKLPDADVSFSLSARDEQDRKCIVGVMEIDGDGQPVRPVKLKKLQPQMTAFACIKFR